MHHRWVLGCRPCRIGRRDPPVHGVPAAKVHEMVIASVFALLAVISLLSILLGSEDSRSSTDPRDDPRIWFALARR